MNFHKNLNSTSGKFKTLCIFIKIEILQAENLKNNGDGVKWWARALCLPRCPVCPRLPSKSRRTDLSTPLVAGRLQHRLYYGKSFNTFSIFKSSQKILLTCQGINHFFHRGRPQCSFWGMKSDYIEKSIVLRFESNK